jgi:signal transduction histidine kinase
MKKSTIWILTIIMALTFGTLLYFQILYLENMVQMRREQFTENVTRAMYGVSGILERQETLYFLERDIIELNGVIYDPLYPTTPDMDNEGEDNSEIDPIMNYYTPTQNIKSRYQQMQDALRNQYRYQRGLLNDVILTIMQESGNRPVMERADSTIIRRSLHQELLNRGLHIPFAFAITTENGKTVYTTSDYDESMSTGVHSITLFPNSDVKYILKVQFPTESKYIFTSVRFIIPTLAFTVVLLVVFLYTIMLAFRQKKLTEMKTDFINNMTHEFKTPISTISLAAQMLNDSSVTKSPAMLSHISSVINEETKRLRLQVERVLVLSMFDNSQISVNLTDLDANKTIENVVNTFKIKVEKFGGSVTCELNARLSTICVDTMHFTNVLFSLLDNAVKYRSEERVPTLTISTEDVNNDTELEIRVSDNGIGIKKDDLKRIFERFYRVSTGNRHDVKGFGIGLAYVKEIVDRFKGSINVESEYDKGTTFIIRLPLCSDTPSS